jgi:hypothetical protein
MYMVSTWALQKSEVGAQDMVVAHLTDLALVTCLYEPFDVLVEEQPPESLQELHPNSINLLVT